MLMSPLSLRDCSLKNILMDATHMYPLGFHPVEGLFLDDRKTLAPRVSRLEAGVQYYFVDYGISSYFSPGSRRELVVGTAGRDRAVTGMFPSYLMTCLTTHSKSTYSQLATSYVANSRL
jgi:hypothetical protein